MIANVRRTVRRGLQPLATSIVVLMLTHTAAASVSLDGTFGAEGRVTTDFGGHARAAAIALQTNGKIVVAGSAGRFRGDLQDFAVARYRPNGRLDRSFGEDGRVTTDVTGKNDAAAAVLIQPGGGIIVAGTGNTLPGAERHSDFALVRYTASGEPDPSFGTGGKVTTDFQGWRDGARALALQPDGKILVGGYSMDDMADGPLFSAIARYNPDGSLDLTFGEQGRILSDAGEILALRVQPDGRIVAAGASFDFRLSRYNQDGSLDANLDGDGIVQTDVGNFHFFGKMAFTPQGGILAPGFLPALSSWGFALARFSPDGTADESFDGDGLVRTIVGGHTSYAFGATSQPDGKIVGVGVSFSVDSAVFAVVRYQPDGSRDPTFGRRGIERTSFHPYSSKAFAATVDESGRAVVAGIAGNDFAICRYLA